MIIQCNLEIFCHYQFTPTCFQSGINKHRIARSNMVTADIWAQYIHKQLCNSIKLTKKHYLDLDHMVQFAMGIKR